MATKGENSNALTDVDLQNVGDQLHPDEWKKLGRHLEVKNLEALEYQYRHSGLSEIAVQMLTQWMQQEGIRATKGKLAEVLKEIGRVDLAQSLMSSSVLEEFTSQQQQRIQNIQHRIEGSQREVCANVRLPQVPWMKKILILEELYVELEMFKTTKDEEESEGTSVLLEEIFHQVDGKNPVRILVEGGPGFGKTTLCLKLLNDWGRRLDYIGSKFKMVFMFQLRYCKEKDSIEELLYSELSEITQIDRTNAMACIEALQNEILLILDGFDETSEDIKKKFLPLLHKKIFPSMFVVVTSRRGMFHVEKKDETPAGIFKSTNQDVNNIHFWNKRVVIKGVAKEKISEFMMKYLKEDYEEFERKITSVTKGEMSEVLQCPLFLILLAIMLEERTLDHIHSKTSLYKEFLNFITRRNLVRENKIRTDEEIDLFNHSSENPLVQSVIQSLVQFGDLSVQSLCENKLTFEEKEISKYFEDRIILNLGFLVKITKLQEHRRDNFYQPIHKSFVEFVAAFSMWNLFNKDENQFKTEIERVAEKGLKPSNDNLFYVFLGGLMNGTAYVLFQCLTPYALYFNMESICFTNILLEIQDNDSFYRSFETLLEPFIPCFYSIDGDKGLNREYFQSYSHSLLLKYASDRKLIKYLWWDTSFDFNITKKLYFHNFLIFLTNDILKQLERENKNSIKCKNVICKFSDEFQEENWKYFVSLLNSIESETLNFEFAGTKNEINSSMLFLLHKELIEGEWKQKNIDRLRFHLNAFDDPLSLSLLVDLVKKNRIKQGVWLEINESEGRTGEELNRMKRETEELFKSVIDSKSIQEFVVNNLDSNFSPHFDFHRENKRKWKTFWFYNYLTVLNSSENEKEKYSVEELIVISVDEEKNLNLIRNIEGIKWLLCSIFCFKSLMGMKWSGLEEIEELYLTNIEQGLLPMNPKLISQLTNLQVLSLVVDTIGIFPSDSRDSFVNLFSSLHLRICEFLFIQSVEIFSSFVEVLMEGLKKKEEGKSSSGDGNEFRVESMKRNKIYLQELLIRFKEGVEIELNELKKCKGIESIRSMLRLNRLGRCCWVNIHRNNIKPDDFLSLFPWNDKFKISRELPGMNPNSSRWSQFNYRWFSTDEMFCVRLVED